MGNVGLQYGLTRTRKRVCVYSERDLAAAKEIVSDFTVQDHFDAYALFEFLLQREIGRSAQDFSAIEIFGEYSSFHRGYITDNDFHNEKQNQLLKTSLDIAKYGMKFVDKNLML